MPTHTGPDPGQPVSPHDGQMRVSEMYGSMANVRIIEIISMNAGPEVLQAIPWIAGYWTTPDNTYQVVVQLEELPAREHQIRKAFSDIKEYLAAHNPEILVSDSRDAKNLALLPLDGNGLEWLNPNTSPFRQIKEAPKLDDVDLLIKHYNHRVLKVNHNVAVQKPNGLWMRYSKEPYFAGLITEFVQEARTAHNKDAGKRISAQSANSVTIQLHGLAEYGEFEQVDLTSHFDTSPIIPFTDGSHIHLDQGREQTCRCILDGTPMIDHGWTVPPPDFSLLEAEKPAIMFYFGDDIFKNAGRRLAGPNKTVDMIISSASDAGKSSLGMVLQLSLPGAIRFLDSSTLSKDKSNFSAHVIHLTESRITIFDEVSRADFDWGATMFEITADIPEVNPKHLQAERRRVIGTAMLIAPTQPEINSAQQGIENRLGAIFKPQLTDHAVSSEERALWLSPAETAKTRAWLLHYAVAGYPYRNKNELYGNKNARQDVIDQAIPEIVELAREALDSLNPEYGYQLEEIKDRLAKAGIQDVPTGNKEFRDLMNACYPKSETRSRRWIPGEKQHRRWTGIGY